MSVPDPLRPARRGPRALLVTTGGVLALALSGCAVTVAQTDLEAEIARGEPGVTEVTCDGALEGSVGAAQDCTATRADGSTINVLVTVVEVDGSTVTFEMTSPDAG